jgi:hypothetical protein
MSDTNFKANCTLLRLILKAEYQTKEKPTYICSARRDLGFKYDGAIRCFKLHKLTTKRLRKRE